MKKYFIVLLLTFLTLNVFAQKISLNDLSMLNKLSMQDFKTNIKEKYNYSYADKTESSDFVLFEYSNYSNKTNRKVGKFEYTKDSTQNSIEYTTTDKKEFDAVNKEIIKLGYKQTGKGKIMGGGNYIDFTLNKYTVRLAFPKKQSNAEFKTQDEYSIIVYN
jgi:hypothetical protein